MTRKPFENLRIIRVLPWRLALACVLVFGLAACGDAADGDTTHGRTFAKSLLEAPCELTPTTMLAGLFDIPADEIEQTPIDLLGAYCSSEWDGNDKTFSMDVSVQVFDDAEQAAQRFAKATRSVTDEEMAAAVNTLKRQAGNDGDASDSEKKETEGILGAIGKQGIKFEGVAELGDEARFKVSSGDLLTRVGNMILTITAYYGEEMLLPDDFSVAAVTKNSTAWTKRTMPTRKQQASEVTQAVIDEL